MNDIIQGAAVAAAVIAAGAFLLLRLRPLLRARKGRAAKAFKSRWPGEAPAARKEGAPGGGCSPSACASCRGGCGLK